MWLVITALLLSPAFCLPTFIHLESMNVGRFRWVVTDWSVAGRYISFAHVVVHCMLSCCIHRPNLIDNLNVHNVVANNLFHSINLTLILISRFVVHLL